MLTTGFSRSKSWMFCVCFTLVCTTGTCQPQGVPAQLSQPGESWHREAVPWRVRQRQQRCQAEAEVDGPGGAGRGQPDGLGPGVPGAPEASVWSLSCHTVRRRLSLSALRCSSGGEPTPVVHGGVQAVGLCRESPSGRWAPFMNEVHFVIQMQDVKLGWDPSPAPPLGTATSCLFSFGQPADCGGQQSLTEVCRAILGPHFGLDLNPQPCQSR